MEDSRLHVSLIGGFRFCKMQVQFGSFKFYIRARACVAELCLILCDPMDCVLSKLLRPWDSPGKDIGVGYHALLRGSSWPRDQTHISYIGRWILYHWATWKAQILCVICLIKGNTPAVPWLGPYPSTAGGTSSICGWGTKIPQATWHGQKFF